jgi:hypothetical protein
VAPAALRAVRDPAEQPTFFKKDIAREVLVAIIRVRFSLDEGGNS